MRRILLFIILFIIHGVIQSQNLIPNGDFELGPDTTSAGWCCKLNRYCTLINYNVPGPKFWIRISGSPDRIVNKDTTKYMCFDNNTAASGKSYITIAIGDTVRATLISPLQKNSIYKLSYYAAIENGGRPMIENPVRFYFRFLNNNDSIISPFIMKKAWHYYDTVFKATANASEVEIIGITTNSSTFQDIDNICLENITATDYHIKEKKIKIHPNPTSGKVFFNYIPWNIKQIELCNLTGQSIIKYYKKDIINNAIDLSFIQDGFYILKINFNEDIYCKQIIIFK